METKKNPFTKFISTAITVIVVIAGFILAYIFPPNLFLNLFYDKIGAEEINELQYNYGQLAGLPAGEGVPLLEDIEQFESLTSLDYITFETDSIIPLPLYQLKSTDDRTAQNRRGQTIRKRPTFTECSFLVENVYNRYYLVKLPDGNYVLSFLDDSYYIKYRLTGKVQLPLGRVDFMLRNEKDYLESYIEEYDLGDQILDMFAEERYEENDFLNTIVTIGVFVVVLVIYILLWTFVSSLLERRRKSAS